MRRKNAAPHPYPAIALYRISIWRWRYAAGARDSLHRRLPAIWTVELRCRHDIAVTDGRSLHLVPLRRRLQPRRRHHPREADRPGSLTRTLAKPWPVNSPGRRNPTPEESRGCYIGARQRAPLIAFEIPVPSRRALALMGRVFGRDTRGARGPTPLCQDGWRRRVDGQHGSVRRRQSDPQSRGTLRCDWLNPESSSDSSARDAPMVRAASPRQAAHSRRAHGVARPRRAFTWGKSSQVGAVLVHLLPIRRARLRP